MRAAGGDRSAGAREGLHGMFDPFARIPVARAEQRIDRLAASLRGQYGANPARDAELPALEQELTALRTRLAEIAAVRDQDRDIRNSRIIALVCWACALLAILAQTALWPGFAGVAVGFIIRGVRRTEALLAPLQDAIAALEAKAHVFVEVVAPRPA